MLLLGTVLVLLGGPTRGEEFSAQIDSFAVSGLISINFESQSLHANLTGTCVNVNISIHTFPVIYGGSLDPCHMLNIGPSLCHIALNGTSSAHLEKKLWPIGLSLVVEACGHQTCSNFHGSSDSVHTWHAIFRSFLVGHIYFLHVLSSHTITALIELSLLEGMPISNATLHFSNSCQSHNHRPVALAEVGTRTEPARSRKELAGTSMMPFLLIEYQGQWACAEVLALRPKTASALFNMQGVNGSFIFRQESPFNPTHIEIELWNLRGLAGNYGIHSLPVPARQEKSQDLCSKMGTGELWNPLGMNRTSPSYPTAPGSSHKEWTIGHLSGRHGSLEGHKEYKAVVKDYNLPLYGPNSIIGRSVAISRADGVQWICGTIRQDGRMIMAEAVFPKSVIGKVLFWQSAEDPGDDMSILIELSHFLGVTSTGHNWHVHEFPLQWEGESCASAGGHFNPYRVPVGLNYSQECKASNALLCEAGDYAGRHRPITIRSNNITRYFFTDTSTTLKGPTSILGKSLVIHGPGGAIFRVACANIILKHSAHGRTGSWFGSGDGQGELSASQTSDLDPTFVNITFQGLKGHAGGFHIHLLPVNGSSADPCSNALIQGHFNPFGVSMTESPAAGNGTDDEYEVGDISGRRGSLVNKDQMTTQYMDLNFPLTGTHSILGRSLVIHYINGSRMQCASFLPELTSDGGWVGAKAVFTGNISGSVTLTQMVYSDGGSSDTFILVDLHAPSENAGKDTNIQWWIAISEKASEVYNPFEIPNETKSMCSSLSLLHCMVGDLSAKHGNMTLGAKQRVTDTNLPMSKYFTVLGLNLTIKWGSYSQSTPILPDVPVSSLIMPRITPFNRSALREAVSLALRVPVWKVTVLPDTERDSGGPCQRVTFFVIGAAPEKKIRRTVTFWKGFNDTAALASLEDQDVIISMAASCHPLPVFSGACRIGIVSLVSYVLAVSYILLV